MMLHSKSSVLLALCIIFFVFQPSALAIKKSYIVYLGSHSHGPEITSADLDKVKENHHEFLGSFLGSKEEAKNAIFYSYKRHINGFAATLDEDTAAEIAKHPDVVSVFLNRAKKLHTTHSWDFLGLENKGTVNHGSLWKKAKFGHDIIIGNLDTGVWPESKSFSDEGFGPIPSKWKGKCHNDSQSTFPCNRKLIGARIFYRGYLADGNKLKPGMDTPRDNEGHGSHTLSTAGGNFVPGANIFGMGNGTAKGGAPRARVAAYKVCWSDNCYDADILKAFDLAIHDGVNVLSLSLGSSHPLDYIEDGIAIGSFHAVKHGVVVVCSAGNSGPDAGTVTNVAPWIITVGASTTDRHFESYLHLRNGTSLKGESISMEFPRGKFYPLISGAQAKAANVDAEDGIFCGNGTLDHKKVQGKILVCLRGGALSRVGKGVQAAQAGAVAMILCNDMGNGNDVLADPHVLPGINLNYTGCQLIFDYLNTSDPQGLITIPRTVLNTKPAPYVVAFSSPGPNGLAYEILKPDIVAPGLNILAAFSEATSPSDEETDNRRVPYTVESGTSMSCPHVSGVVALLKAVHPDWSPAAIRSAIMTTASTRDNTGHQMLDSFGLKATPFSYGAGHIRPSRATDPGLVYDLKISDYLDFLCNRNYNQTAMKIFSGGPYKCPDDYDLLNFNNPAIVSPYVLRPVTFTRTLKNVGPPGTYRAHVHQPKDMLVTVMPNVLTFKKFEEKSFNVTIKPTKVDSGFFRFGELLWTDGHHHVRSPIAAGAFPPDTD